MKAVFGTIIGLVFDDWWLAMGLLISIVISYLAVAGGMDKQTAGWLLLLLIVGTLIVSLAVEYRKKTKKTS